MSLSPGIALACKTPWFSSEALLLCARKPAVVHVSSTGTYFAYWLVLLRGQYWQTSRELHWFALSHRNAVILVGGQTEERALLVTLVTNLSHFLIRSELLVHFILIRCSTTIPMIALTVR